MATKAVAPQMVPIGRVFLHVENPRHEPVLTEANAIEKLCGNENVLDLARDIVRHGTNPLDLIGLVPIDERKTTKGNPTFIVAEGNRRVCALKLLNDTDLAPAALRKSFEEMAKGWSTISEVAAIVFPTMDEARLWMERIHNGLQGGVGRKTWNADQKTRFDGGSKNKIALALLEYAEQIKILNPGERERKLTTAQRFLSNDVFREMLGIYSTDASSISRTRPKQEFDTILKRFVRDLVDGKEVHSRMNKKDIIDYTRELSGLSGITVARIDPEPLTEGVIPEKVKTFARKSSRKPPRIVHVQYHEEIHQALRTLGNNKLQSLYHSICSIELESHTPLVSVGIWSWFETLTACAGKNDNTAFDAFLSKSRLAGYGLPTTNRCERR